MVLCARLVVRVGDRRVEVVVGARRRNREALAPSQFCSGQVVLTQLRLKLSLVDVARAVSVEEVEGLLDLLLLLLGDVSGLLGALEGLGLVACLSTRTHQLRLGLVRGGTRADFALFKIYGDGGHLPFEVSFVCFLKLITKEREISLSMPCASIKSKYSLKPTY